MGDSVQTIDYRSYIGHTLEIVINRPNHPLGSRPPHYGYEYPVNYGYLPEIMAGDGEAIDVYMLGVAQPVEQATARCIAVIHRHDDDEDKLVATLDGAPLKADEILRQLWFQKRFFQVEILFE